MDEERERARLALAGIDVHRVKMKEHRAAVALAESKRESHQALEEQRRRVRELREKREKQRRDLEDPNGRAVQEGKVVEGKGEGLGSGQSILRLLIRNRTP